MQYSTYFCFCRNLVAKIRSYSCSNPNHNKGFQIECDVCNEASVQQPDQHSIILGSKIVITTVNTYIGTGTHDQLTVAPCPTLHSSTTVFTNFYMSTSADDNFVGFWNRNFSTFLWLKTYCFLCHLFNAEGLEDLGCSEKECHLSKVFAHA